MIQETCDNELPVSIYMGLTYMSNGRSLIRISSGIAVNMQHTTCIEFTSLDPRDVDDFWSTSDFELPQTSDVEDFCRDLIDLGYRFYESTVTIVDDDVERWPDRLTKSFNAKTGVLATELYTIQLAELKIENSFKY